MCKNKPKVTQWEVFFDERKGNYSLLFRRFRIVSAVALKTIYRKFWNTIPIIARREYLTRMTFFCPSSVLKISFDGRFPILSYRDCRDFNKILMKSSKNLYMIQSRKCSQNFAKFVKLIQYLVCSSTCWKWPSKTVLVVILRLKDVFRPEKIFFLANFALIWGFYSVKQIKDFDKI